MADNPYGLSQQDIEDLKVIAQHLQPGDPRVGKVNLLINSVPTQFEQAHTPAERGSTLMSDLGGMVKSLPKMAMDVGSGGVFGTIEQAKADYDAYKKYGKTATVMQDEQRQAAGHGLAYRALAPVGAQAVGLNLPGMEASAERGDRGAVVEHAAAPLVAQAATAGAVKAASGIGSLRPSFVSSPLGDMVAKPRGVVPAEAATPQELMAYAEANNIPINAAQATEHNLPRNLQSVGERATIGGTAVKNQVRAAQAAVVDHAQQLQRSFSPQTQDLGQAGQAIKSNVESALAQERATANQNFQAVEQAAQGTRVDLTPTIDLTKNILGEHGTATAISPQLGPKRALSIVKAIQDAPESLRFTDAQQLRSALLDEAMHPDNAISTQGQGIIKRLIGSLDNQMMSAASTSKNPQLQQAFRNANEHWKGLQEDFNTQRSPLYQILSEPDPFKVPQKLTQQGSIGGSPYVTRLLDKYGIDKGPVKFAVMDDLLKKDFGLYNGGKTLAGYSHNYLRSVFTPEELSNVYKTGAIARSTKLNTNPSGTAAVESAAADVQKPIRSMMPKALAARATSSPAVNEWMMRNPPPVGQNAAAMSGWLARRQAFIRSLAVTAAAGAGRNREEQ